MFKLLIECSKDIDKLMIDFSDGTSVVTESKTKPCKEKQKETNEIKEKKERIFADSLVFPQSSQSEKPRKVSEDLQSVEIPDVSNRPVKIDENLNNLDF